MSDEERGRMRELERENAVLRFCVDSYWRSQGPLLLEIDRLKKALARAEEAR